MTPLPLSTRLDSADTAKDKLSQGYPATLRYRMSTLKRQDQPARRSAHPCHWQLVLDEFTHHVTDIIRSGNPEVLAGRSGFAAIRQA